MNRVIIMSGIPGSGKSTYIVNNLWNAYVCSADHHFISENGEYKFDHTKLGAAHAACMAKFDRLIDEQRAEIVVDNTNLHWRDFSYYVIEALARGYKVEVIHIKCDLETAARNVHSVPAGSLARMAAKKIVIPEYITDAEKFSYIEIEAAK